MRIKYRCIFSSRDKGFDIAAFLTQQGVKYDCCEELTIFELFEEQANFDTILNRLEPYGLLRNPPVATYTKNEINAAQWLSVRSTWRSLYPQPEEKSAYKFSTYDSSNYCEKCGYGLIQKENFMLKKEPKWGSRNFLMINWIHDEFFISKKAEIFLMASDLTGFDIYDVFSKSKNVMEGVKQIFVRYYLDYGLKPESIKEELHCTRCNYIKIMANPVIYYDNKVFENIDCDIVKTKEMFGEITCCSKIIISHKFYKAITNTKLDRGLVFEPVNLV
ncbi:MAG: hypothetical protein FWG14_13410 [Peptococcaceae bacterium]|nr:hypothetical protein [Peptococcaceae bacterium]